MPPGLTTSPGRFVDLQTHSTASDGAAAPEAVVRAARAAGLEAIALTDHDTIDGFDAAAAAGRVEGVRVVAGVELSAYDGDQEIHLLGLHLEPDAPLRETLATLRAARRERAAEIVSRLNLLGIGVTLSAVLDAAAGGAIGRPHVALALIDGGWARDRRDAFDRYLGANGPAFVPKLRLSVADAIAIVHQAGGLSVLAHPGAQGTRAFIEPLVGLGLDGVEVLHPGHSRDDRDRLGALVEFFGLVPSGGSDWHGATSGARTLGRMKVPAEWLARQDARVARMRQERRSA